jgi:hypothetical protein
MAISKNFFFKYRNLVTNDGIEIKELHYEIINTNSPCHQYYQSNSKMLKYCEKAREN